MMQTRLHTHHIKKQFDISEITLLLTVCKILTSPKILVRVLLILTKRVLVNYCLFKTD
jgi:hypothetical protein